MKQRTWIKKAVVGILVTATAIGTWNWCEIPEFAEFLRPKRQYAAMFAEEEQLCSAFFEEKMISERFEIYTNYTETTEKGELATGHDVLSESYGLMMMRAVMQNDRKTFDECNTYLLNNLWNGNFLSWRKNSVTGENSSVNASVDDLRVIQSLLLGYETWQERSLYRQAQTMARKLYRHNVRNGSFTDMYDEASDTSSATVTLCYQNLSAFQMLRKIDRRWDEVYQNALATLQEGYLGDTLPLYQTRKNTQTGLYETETVNSIESLLTVLHLAEVGEVRTETLQWLRQNALQGTLYGLYDEETGQPATTLQSTAVYAIAAIIGATVEDETLYQAAITHMNLYQVKDANSEIYGAYGDAASKTVYSFDNLYALSAFCY